MELQPGPLNCETRLLILYNNLLMVNGASIQEGEELCRVIQVNITRSNEMNLRQGKIKITVRKTLSEMH